jgi:hypothetical protein
MFFRLSLAAALIAATVVIQAVFMSAGLRIFKRIEEHKPGSKCCHHDSDMDPVPADPNCSRCRSVGDVLLRKRRITGL